jgi:hypothetical protein
MLLYQVHDFLRLGERLVDRMPSGVSRLAGQSLRNLFAQRTTSRELGGAPAASAVAVKADF